MDEERAGGNIPFGVHQVIEYLLGGFAIASIARVEERSVLLCIGVGVGLILFAGVSGGRVGFLALVPPRLHRVLDYVVAAALATSPWWSGVGWSAGGVWLVAVLALALVALARSTSYRRTERTARRTPAGPTPARAAGRVAGAVGRKGPRAAGVAVGRIMKRRRQD